MKTLDFGRSYYRFYADFAMRDMRSLSHKPPTQTNRTRICLEASCHLRRLDTGEECTYYLTAACKTEQVGAGKGELWLLPSADVIFLVGAEDFAVYKSWSRCEPGVMLYPPERGPQPERQLLRTADNFDDVRVDLCEVEAEVAAGYEAVAEAIMSDRPMVSRIEYEDEGYAVCIDQPVKTINLCERDGLFQTDTGPIIVPDLRPERVAGSELLVGVFDLAYSAWREWDWAEFVINEPVEVADGVRVNHYSRARLIEGCRNSMLVL